jgi:2-iminobutanoate/2-iminopropanoate deaminase
MPEPRLAEPIVPREIRHQPLPFSPAIRAGEFVFVSGQASVDAGGEIVSGSFGEEVRRSMDNLRAVLVAAGCTFAHVVQVRAYVHDPDDLAEFNRLYRDYFDQPWPARTTLMNCLGPIKFEIDAIARVPNPDDPRR